MKRNIVLGPQRVALVTGGSSGIGLAVARLLAQQGNHVWLLARNPERLKQALHLLEEHRVLPEQRFDALQADVSAPAQVFAAIANIQDEVGTPDLVINSAGIAYPGYVQELDLHIFRQMMEVNYFGCVHTTKAVLPGMLKRRSGHLVFISSMGGLISVFGYTAYSASKFALHGFCDALRQEMKPHGIRVSIVTPSDTDTPQLAFENQFKPPETRYIAGNAPVVSPEYVARQVLRGISRGQYLIIPGINLRLFYLLKRALGSRFDYIMDILIAHAQRNSRFSLN